jgi:ligand-binding sensor domain-containing protein
MGRLSWIFAIYLGLVHIQIQAQNYYSNPDIQFDRYSVSQGLSHIAVNSITQDSWGFIWIGTYDGLNRFDGTNFKVFKRVPDDSTTLINNRVHCIIEHSSGKLFIEYVCITGVLKSLKKQVWDPLTDKRYS